MTLEEKPLILRLYYLLVSFGSLVVLTVAIISLLYLGLTVLFFPSSLNQPPWGTRICFENENQEQCKQAQTQELQVYQIQQERTIIRNVSMLVVALPLFWFHGRVIYGNKNSKEKILKS